MGRFYYLWGFEEKEFERLPMFLFLFSIFVSNNFSSLFLKKFVYSNKSFPLLTELYCLISSLCIQVETDAQFGVVFLLFALGLEFSLTKVILYSNASKLYNS